LVASDLREPIRAILLDFDGTIVDSEPLHFEAWMEAVEPHGAGVGWDEYRQRFVGKTDVWAGQTFLAEAGHPADPETVESVRQTKHRIFRSRAPERLRIEADTLSALGQLVPHVRLAVVSSSDAQDVEPVLESADLRRSIETTVYGGDVLRHKPDPEPYELAVARLRASEDIHKAECLVFEDSSAGVAAAQAAGLPVEAVDDPRSLPGLLQAAFLHVVR